MAIKTLQQHLNFDFIFIFILPSNKISPVKKFNFLLLLHAFPSSTHFFCYVPFSPPPSSYTHFFFYFFSFSFFLHPLFFHILSFLPPFSPFMVSLLRRCCSLVAFLCVFLLQHYMQCCKCCCFLCSSFPCVLQITMFFFNAISSYNILYDYMMMLHSSFLHVLQIKVLLFNATSSCNVICDVVAFFFSTSITNYSFFFLEQ